MQIFRTMLRLCMAKVSPIPLTKACEIGNDNATQLYQDLLAIYGSANAPHIGTVYRWWTGKKQVGPQYVPMVLEYARGRGVDNDPHS